MLKVLSIFGTRPEAIKMAPVIRAMAAQPEAFDSKVCVTAQHRSMLDQTLELFEIIPDHDLDIMAADQSPTQVAAAVLSKLEPILKAEKPDWVLVQGDTTTTATAALAAFYARVKIGHIEAGLRTNDKSQPFPEEINRRVVSLIADLHFAATEPAKRNLLDEGIPPASILVTGNPVIDALQIMLRRPPPADIAALVNGDRKLVLVTAHRRENFGRPLENICEALLTVARRYDGQVRFVYPVHENPNVREPVWRLLGKSPNITLLSPLDYLSLIHLANFSHIIVTDSGGLQEEGPSLGKPVLVMRNVTERPETVAAGTARVIGVETDRIVAEVSRILDDEQAYQSMRKQNNLFGDGNASARILQGLLNYST
ncbi:MAG TPA: UDP-N-acetylglucosamine 2-epimerase (non-hydrolyzing) [Pyrinomonadaceae bacterium]|nr:UDP-N-acetylglucosamine 2-epimerase (non-hydrolyzing) [Pyrinomonadaceae bacterium]